MGSADSKLTFAAPKGERLHRIDDNIYVIDASLCTSFGDLPMRMTVIKLRDGSILAYSPFDPDLVKDEIQSLAGTVKHVIAPNMWHHLWARKFADHYGATLYSSPGLPQKFPDKRWGVLFSGLKADLFGPDVSFCLVQGMPKTQEIVLLHHPSKTIVVSDLCFNFTSDMIAKAPWAGRLYLNWAVRRPCCISKPFKWMIDAKSLKKALEENILPWDFDKVIVAHGVNVLENGKELFKQGTYAFVSELVAQAERPSSGYGHLWGPYVLLGIGVAAVGAIILSRK